MDRGKLLAALDEYGNRYPQEMQTVNRFVELVEGEPRCYERDCWRGHVTGSAWLVDPAQERLLLTHHKKLGIWVQLGGHSDGDPDTRAVATREAEEESCLEVDLLDERVFDIDIHTIPARKSDPQHFHFDVRFALVARTTDFVVTSESLELEWVPIERLETRTKEASILRMRDKWGSVGEHNLHTSLDN